MRPRRLGFSWSGQAHPFYRSPRMLSKVRLYNVLGCRFTVTTCAVSNYTFKRWQEDPRKRSHGPPLLQVDVFFIMLNNRCPAEPKAKELRGGAHEMDSRKLHSHYRTRWGRNSFHYSLRVKTKGSPDHAKPRGAPPSKAGLTISGNRPCPLSDQCSDCSTPDFSKI